MHPTATALLEPEQPAEGEHPHAVASAAPVDSPSAPPPVEAAATVEAPYGVPLMEAMAPPSPPPDVTAEAAPAQPPRGPRLRRLAAVLVLLATLGVGLGAGTVFGSSRAAGSAIVLGARSAPAITVSATTRTVQQDVQSVAAAVLPSVVKITSTSPGGQGAVGSGDILTADGYIVTNDHVVRGFSSFTVTLSNGSTYTATLVGEAPLEDLAVLKIAATGLTPIAFANSSQLQVGQFAIAIGNPLALTEAQTLGIVSALNQTASEAPSGPASVLTGLIQTSAPINPGNSGGALVNLQGQLIGIPTLEAIDPTTGAAANNLGFAIPANRVQAIATQLIQHGRVLSTGQGYLGIQAQDVTPRVAAAAGLSTQSGVLVMGFAQDAAGTSPAQAAGLQVGDVILAIDGTPITNNLDLSGNLLPKAPNTRVTLTVLRGGTQLSLPVTLGERPAQ